MDGIAPLVNIFAARASAAAYRGSRERVQLETRIKGEFPPSPTTPMPLCALRPYGFSENRLRILCGRQAVAEYFANLEAESPDDSPATSGAAETVKPTIPGKVETRTEDAAEDAAINTSAHSAEVAEPATSKGIDGESLTPEELRLVRQLQQIDADVRAHEQAHVAAARGLAVGGAHFQYQAGPDGKRYAVGGEVQIDISREHEPEDTVHKMQIARAAALAPADPSPQDRRVAAAAAQRGMQARQEILLEAAEERQQSDARAAAREKFSASSQSAGGQVENEYAHGSPSDADPLAAIAARLAMLAGRQGARRAYSGF